MLEKLVYVLNMQDAWDVTTSTGISWDMETIWLQLHIFNQSSYNGYMSEVMEKIPAPISTFTITFRPSIKKFHN